jgi:dTDP-4-amino-4,6-dideoxygalactose transaminase
VVCGEIYKGAIAMKPIQVLKPYFRVEECLEQVRECLEKGWTGLGFKTVEFENKWKEYTGLPNAHFLNSATAGLHLALKILKERYTWNDADEVITTPFTFVSTNHAIMYENLHPVFADIDDSLNMNPESVLAKITNKTRAIVFVGIGGNTKNLTEVIAIAKKYDLKFILDAAHMSGSMVDDRHVGFDCDVSVFSFQAVKNLPTADSGMICFADSAMDKKARELSWLGINKDTFERSKEGSYKWDYQVDHVGYKYHGNSIMAGLGLVGLKYLKEDNEYRKMLSKEYERQLAGKIKFIQHTAQSSHHTFQIVVENRADFIELLTQHGIYPGVHYRINTDYAPYNYAKGTCPVAEYYSERVLSLPLHLELTTDDVSHIVSIINRGL